MSYKITPGDEQNHTRKNRAWWRGRPCREGRSPRPTMTRKKEATWANAKTRWVCRISRKYGPTNQKRGGGGDGSVTMMIPEDNEENQREPTSLAALGEAFTREKGSFHKTGVEKWIRSRVRKNDLDYSPAEEHLNDFFDDGKETRMVHPNSPPQKALDSDDLRRNSKKITEWYL